ncbi:trypco2 family protein [Nonomuraea sp. ZG12]|uniref:trypco2 family protein n=1 Tax=Nonomuraea sp. ZG12 TaxID=3452207 RepID=UPI003F8B4EE7
MPLAATIAALREELAEAMRAARDADVRFEVGQVQVEFNIGVTRETGGQGKAKFWVLELGGESSYQKEEIQRVTLTLEAPVDRAGRPVRVTREFTEKP